MLTTGSLQKGWQKQELAAHANIVSCSGLSSF